MTNSSCGNVKSWPIVFALFWFFILGIQLVLLVMDTREARGRRIKPFLGLCLCAAGSGLIAAAVLGLVLKDTFPEQGFVERVVSQVKYLTFEAHDKSQSPPWWVYLRNFPAFGCW